MAARRGPREDSIYYDHKTPCRDPDEHRRCTGSWRGVVSLGYGPDGKRIRRKVRGQTKTEVRDKLRDLHTDIESGLRKPEAVTVREAAEDWLAHGLDGRSAKTVRKNRDVLMAVLAVIGRPMTPEQITSMHSSSEPIRGTEATRPPGGEVPSRLGPGRRGTRSGAGHWE
jgi:hypothetical protein